MSSSQSQESAQALGTNRKLGQEYYDIALPAISERFTSINQGLGEEGGLPDYLKTAYGEQRTNLSEGVAASEQGNVAATAAKGKKATEGGNVFAGMSTSDMGAQLANALYGSKFQEGQAGVNQTMNLMSMALGGAGTTGNAALQASSNELGALRYIPNYNTTYANIVGGAAGASSIYGKLNRAGAFDGSGGGGMVPGLMPSTLGNAAFGSEGVYGAGSFGTGNP